MIRLGFFSNSTLEAATIIGAPEGACRNYLLENWTRRWPIEAANVLRETREETLTLLCRRRLRKKILENRRNP